MARELLRQEAGSEKHGGRMDELSQELLTEFLLESRERLERMEEILLQLPSAAAESLPRLLEEVARELHTLKGNSGLVGFAELQAIAHAMEDELEGIDPRAPQVTGLLERLDGFRNVMESPAGGGGTFASSGEASTELAQGGVRVAFSTLDALVDLLAEMVIFGNRLSNGLGELRHDATAEALDEVESAHDLLGKTLARLQEGVMQLRMVPLRTLFRHLGRLVHDEALRQRKEARFVTTGGDTPLDKALLEVSSEALGHLVRNAVAHGIETPAERLRAGKRSEGIVRLSATATAREVRIEVEDDGAGVRSEEVLAAAARRGIELPPGQNPLSLLFLPGMSTRTAADLTSGRGVGLSAVQEAVHRRGGRVEVGSEPGAGTLFRLRLPLSVSITRALLLSSRDERYLLPLASVVESLSLDAARLHEVNGVRLLSWRGGLIPLLDLGRSFGGFGGVIGGAGGGKARAVVFESDGAVRALGVDRIHGIRRVVVKELDAALGNPCGLSGATVLGDGSAVLILDPAGLMSLSPAVADA
jgi:two-component system chemotaxis sensor kinase CheA